MSPMPLFPGLSHRLHKLRQADAPALRLSASANEERYPPLSRFLQYGKSSAFTRKRFQSHHLQSQKPRQRRARRENPKESASLPVMAHAFPHRAKYFYNNSGKLRFPQ
jgi:hypothetical protein